MTTRLVARLCSPTFALTMLLIAGVVRFPLSSPSAQTTTTGVTEASAVVINGARVADTVVTVTRATGRNIAEAPGFSKFEQADVEFNLTKTSSLTASLKVAPISDTGGVLVTGWIPGPQATPTRPVTVGDAFEFKIDTTKFGPVKVYLPNDIRPGDTVSGSLLWEKPEVGATETVTVDSKDAAVRSAGSDFTVRVPTELPIPVRSFINLAVLIPSTAGAAPEKTTLFIPLNTIPGSTASDFVFPPLTQQGRASQVQGPFDGDAANTRVSIGTGSIIKPLAESPRKVIFIAPADLAGPYEINVNEGDRTFAGKSRNIAVKLSAPKTNLLRGEKTTVTIEVSGLQGIINDVPLQLDARGVINMDGGNFQNLRIKPEEIKLDGRYTTDRSITGLAAGGFSVTATVIVGPFDVCLQDDANRAGSFRWNTFTGDYVFTNPAPPKPPGGTVQPGGTTQTGAPKPPSPSGANLAGIGKPSMKGCIITLSHNAPDRRVFARLDICTKTGDAQVETKSPRTTSEIMDKNTGDNSCPSAPPK